MAKAHDLSGFFQRQQGRLAQAFMAYILRQGTLFTWFFVGRRLLRPCGGAIGQHMQKFFFVFILVCLNEPLI
jgi:hypothetical protein